MTETLSDRLRSSALLDAHFAVPAEREEITSLLHEAADELDAIRQRAESAILSAPQPSARAAVDAWMDRFVERSQHFEDTLTKAKDQIRDLKRDCIDKAYLLQGEKAERRAFLERAVCHPGPPLSEHEDYDPEADLGELEASVLERMDLELKAERELQDIRKMCEEALGRTPDPARSTMQVVRELCAHHSAARTYRANMEDPPVDLEAHETTRRMIDEFATYPGRDEEGRLLPTVRPEHLAGRTK